MISGKVWPKLKLKVRFKHFFPQNVLQHLCSLDRGDVDLMVHLSDQFGFKKLAQILVNQDDIVRGFGPVTQKQTKNSNARNSRDS